MRPWTHGEQGGGVRNGGGGNGDTCKGSGNGSQCDAVSGNGGLTLESDDGSGKSYGGGG